MAIECGTRCRKGDILDIIEILVEQRSTNNHVTVAMWKRHDDKFVVAKKQVRQKWEDIIKYKEDKDEATAVLLS